MWTFKCPQLIENTLQIEFIYAGFWEEGKTVSPRKKPLGAEKMTNNKLKAHKAWGMGNEGRNRERRVLITVHYPIWVFLGIMYGQIQW